MPQPQRNLSPACAGSQRLAGGVVVAQTLADVLPVSRSEYLALDAMAFAPASVGWPFPVADKPYEKLKRALRAEVDEAAWSALYSTVSRPFDPPETGKIAVKVINHYGDEVLHVYEV